MEINRCSECLRTARSPPRRPLTAVDLSFRLPRPFPSMIMTNKGLGDPAPFEADLDLPMPRCQLSNVGHHPFRFSITNPSHTVVETWRKASKFRLQKSVMACV